MPSPADPATSRAVRATVHGRVQGVGFRWATVERAQELGVLGWVRNQEDGTVYVHAEGAPDALATFLGFLGEGPAGAAVDDVDVGEVKVEGHEQFAQRGVPAGRFVVADFTGEGAAGPGGRSGYVLTLEVDGLPRSWRLAKAPSMNPADKRMAFPVSGEDRPDSGPVTAVSGRNPLDDPATPWWDGGLYEQGGRVPWPEAMERGHAVFVLKGERLMGGFALQRIRGEGASAQWLLIKRREAAAP